MPRLNSKRASAGHVVIGGLLLLAGGTDNIMARAATDNLSSRQTGIDLQLEVMVNGISSGWIAAIHQTPDGTLTIMPEQLRNCGLLPQNEAIRPDGKIDIARLQGVLFQHDEIEQRLLFTAEHAALAPRKLDGGGRKSDRGDEPKPASALGALVNYTFYSSYDTSDIGAPWQFSGVSGSFENRIFGPFGTLTSSQLASFSQDSLSSTTRLDTTWSYSDPDRITSYRMGDVITGGLAWTRPVRLGGMQIQRNFSLRPDLITMPLPELSSNAAIPSTVDVYINNTRRLSQDVPAGPFLISDVPVVTGDSTARLVVRDGLGRETVTETPLYASASLLDVGMMDYSAEIGFARQSYGTESFSYDALLVGSGTLRYGLTQRMTLESHIEGGDTFATGGMALVAGLGSFGVGTVGGAWSHHESGEGYLASASIDASLWGMTLRDSTVRTFEDYQDIASIASENVSSHRSAPVASSGQAKALDQLAVAVPLDFTATSLNFTYTHMETTWGDRSRIVGVSANRSFGETGNMFVTAYTDVERKNAFGLFAGVSWSFGNNKSASMAAISDASGTSIVSEAFARRQGSNNTLDMRLRDSEGQNTARAVAVTYSDPTTRASGRIEQWDKAVSVKAEAEGALVLIGGEVFATRQIDDAFAVIDAGSPGVEVEFENRPIGKTGRRGKMLIPDLRSYESNAISINPESLPIHSSVDKTSEKIVPHTKSGVWMDFGIKTQIQSAVVVLKRQDGQFVAAGSVVSLEDGTDGNVVGYDGQAYLTEVSGRRRLVVSQTGFPNCGVDVDFGISGQGRNEFGPLACEDIP